MNLVCSLLVIFFVKRIFGDEVISTGSSSLLRRNNSEPDIPYRRINTGPNIPFRQNYTGSNVPFLQNYTEPNIPFRQNDTGPHIAYRQNNAWPHIPFPLNYTGSNIPFQQNDMQPDVLRTLRPWNRRPVTFKTVSEYRHVTDPIWKFEEIDYNFVNGKLYQEQHDCIGVNMNCVMDRMFTRPICVANYYMKYNRGYGKTPMRLLSICEMDYRNCVYRNSYQRWGYNQRHVYGIGYHDDDLEIAGEHEEVSCMQTWSNRYD